MYLLAVVLLVFTMNACQKDKLNPSSSTSLPDDQVFINKDRIANQVNGLYGALKSGDLLGGRYLIYNDIRGENFINENGNGVTGLLVWNFTVTGGDTYVNRTWNAAYSAINQVNVFLDGMQTKGNAVVGDALAKQYEGEAKFVRAVAYYCLMQLYAPPYNGTGTAKALPLRLTPIREIGHNDLARSNVAEVYTQILKDLDDAEAKLPLDYNDAALNTTHAHRNTAIALKTRVYLSIGFYPNVITEANKIVSASAPFKATSGVANTLQSDITTVFASPYSTKESIFSMPFTSVSEQPGTQNQLGYYYLSAAAGGNGEYSLNAAGIISDKSWTSADKRWSFVTKNAGGTSWLRKYPGGSPYVEWVPVLRYSEVLLNLAEARAKTTNTVDPQAVALLNAVRHRSDETTTYTVVSFSSATDLINAILKERQIEFLGEGMRSPDIMRLGLNFPAKGSVKTVAPADPGYIFPAPTSETQYNSLW